jgi:hypothetical protein
LPSCTITVILLSSSSKLALSSISNEELLITTNVKFTNQAGGNVVELESFLEQMPAIKFFKGLPIRIKLQLQRF